MTADKSSKLEIGYSCVCSKHIESFATAVGRRRSSFIECAINVGNLFRRLGLENPVVAERAVICGRPPPLTSSANGVMPPAWWPSIAAVGWQMWA